MGCSGTKPGAYGVLRAWGSSSTHLGTTPPQILGSSRDGSGDARDPGEVPDSCQHPKASGNPRELLWSRGLRWSWGPHGTPKFQEVPESPRRVTGVRGGSKPQEHPWASALGERGVGVPVVVEPGCGRGLLLSAVKGK